MKYIEIPINKFTTTDSKRNALDTMQAVSEWVFDWNIDNDGGAWDIKLSDCCHDIAEAYEYIRSETGVPVHELKEKYSEQIEHDFRRALANSFMLSYEYEWLRGFYKSMQDNIHFALQELADKAYFVYTDKKEVHKVSIDADYSELKYCWEADTIRVYATKEDLRDFIGSDFDYQGMLYDDLANEAYELIGNDAKEVNTEYIDYHGGMGDSSDWLTCFKDAEETSGIVKKDIQKRVRQTEAYIKHNVPLIYRTA